jgi:hypothetical protein
MIDIAGSRNNGRYTVGRRDAISCNRYTVGRVNEHYNGYTVGNRGLDDLRDTVLKPGIMNFVMKHWLAGQPMLKRKKSEVGATNIITVMT